MRQAGNPPLLRNQQRSGGSGGGMKAPILQQQQHGQDQAKYGALVLSGNRGIGHGHYQNQPKQSNGNLAVVVGGGSGRGPLTVTKGLTQKLSSMESDRVRNSVAPYRGPPIPDVPRDEIRKNHIKASKDKDFSSTGCDLYAIVLRNPILNKNRHMAGTFAPGISTSDSMFVLVGSLKEVKGSSDPTASGHVFVETVPHTGDRVVRIYSSIAGSYLKKYNITKDSTGYKDIKKLRITYGSLCPYKALWLSGIADPNSKVGDFVRLKGVTLSASQYKPKEGSSIMERRFSTFANFRRVEGGFYPFSQECMIKFLDEMNVHTRWFHVPPTCCNYSKDFKDAMPLDLNDVLFVKSQCRIPKDTSDGSDDGEFVISSTGDFATETEDIYQPISASQDKQTHQDGGDVDNNSMEQERNGGVVGNSAEEDPYVNGAIVRPIFNAEETNAYGESERTIYHLEVRKANAPADVKDRVLGMRLMCEVYQRIGPQHPIVKGVLWISAYSEAISYSLGISDMEYGEWLMDRYLRYMELSFVCTVNENNTRRRFENSNNLKFPNNNKFTRVTDNVPLDDLCGDNENDVKVLDEYIQKYGKGEDPYKIYGLHDDAYGIQAMQQYEAAQGINGNEVPGATFQTVNDGGDYDEPETYEGGNNDQFIEGGGMEPSHDQQQQQQEVYDGGFEGWTDDATSTGSGMYGMGDECQVVAAPADVGEEEEEIIRNYKNAFVDIAGAEVFDVSSKFVDSKRNYLFAYVTNANIIYSNAHSFYIRVGIPVSWNMAQDLAVAWRSEKPIDHTDIMRLMFKTGLMCLNDHPKPSKEAEWALNDKHKVSCRVMLDIKGINEEMINVFASLDSKTGNINTSCEEGDKFIAYILNSKTETKVDKPYINHVFESIRKTHTKKDPRTGRNIMFIPESAPWSKAIHYFNKKVKKDWKPSSKGVVFLVVDPEDTYILEKKTLNAFFNGRYELKVQSSSQQQQQQQQQSISAPPTPGQSTNRSVDAPSSANKRKNSQSEDSDHTKGEHPSGANKRPLKQSRTNYTNEEEEERRDNNENQEQEHNQEYGNQEDEDVENEEEEEEEDEEEEEAGLD